MISSWILRASAGLLALAGVALLFASDEILPRLAAGFPPAGAWLGQLLAAALLALAELNWLGRSQLVGGIYGRPVVLANATFYFMGSTVVLKEAARHGGAAPWTVGLVLAAFAAVYWWLLLRGPFERDFQASRGSARAS